MLNRLNLGVVDEFAWVHWGVPSARLVGFCSRVFTQSFFGVVGFIWFRVGSLGGA